MQHQQQHDGGQAAAEVVMRDEHQKVGDLGGIPEAASPISSRPPASSNFEEMMRATAEGGGGASFSSGGNRWPRQETLALLQIRSEMDAAFRDATLKGPLWEQVSRKLAELGYKRSAKKCKEKFENVHKYYKRTKEGRGGRQDGKSYKFFTQLEALHTPSTPLASHHPPPHVTVSLPPPIPQPEPPIPQPHHITAAATAIAATAAAVATPATRDASAVPLFGSVGISFSSDSSSSSEEEDDETEDTEMAPAEHSRKRMRRAGGDTEETRMMEFFEGLIRQVMQKQEAMQQRFLEAIEKREKDRMIREEAWKRQDMARLVREHELMAKERAVSASRDAAIIDFLQKITGQTIHLPQNPPPLAAAQPPPPPPPQPQQQLQRGPTSVQQQQPEQGINPSRTQSIEPRDQLVSNTRDIVVAIPEQQMPLQEFSTGGGGSLEMASSRWPKTEVLALIQLRSSLESRYHETGPKGPLWEEISAGMQRMGYNRSAKRCKEKWENINKYFKKVKESNKKRPEDAKTCPYFHELDALYRKKILGNTDGGGSIGGSLSEQERQQKNAGTMSLQLLQGNDPSGDKDGGNITELKTSNVGGSLSTVIGEQSQGNIGGAQQPEDMLKKQHLQGRIGDNLMNGSCNYDIDFSNSDGLDQVNDDEEYDEVDEDEEYDVKTEEQVYKIEFQRQNVGSSGGGGTGSTSFMAMVQ